MAAVATTTTVRPTGRRPSVGRMAAWAVMAAIVLITLLPFYWILRTALSTNTALAAHPGDPLPVGLTSGGFERALGATQPAVRVNPRCGPVRAPRWSL